MSGLTYNDINGDLFTGTQEGENLVNNDINKVIFRHEMPAANNPFEFVAFTHIQVENFVKDNACQIRMIDNSIDVGVACRIAFLRLLAAHAGLISPNFDQNTHHVHYNDAVRLNQADTQAFLEVANRPEPTDANIAAALTGQVKEQLRSSFTDRVCLVAYVFRARGHHWIAGLDDLYLRVWQKCRYDPNQVYMSFQQMAVTALHGIFPDILDNFWGNAVNNSLVNGALVKRYDVAPAGVAGLVVVHAGLQDIKMVAPGLPDRVPDSIAYLDQKIAEVRANRWNGSINHRYYGANRVVVDEKQIGAIAAVIYSAVDNLADRSPLLQSKALQRIAHNAPITGAVLGNAIAQIANRKEVVNALLIAPN